MAISRRKWWPFLAPVLIPADRQLGAAAGHDNDCRAAVMALVGAPLFFAGGICRL